jgi:hypothetical protein
MRLRIKWDLNELKNQLLHITAGVVLTYWIYYITNINDYKLLFVGLIVGVGVEIYQYFFQDSKVLHIQDRVRDVFFYVVGSILIWLV